MRPWLVVSALLALLILSFLARGNVVLHRPLAGYMDNEDAASHVIATSVAYSQTPWQVHRFLPIFTYGHASNKSIDDLPTSSVRDRYGNVYYASFPPGAFVMAYFLLRPDPICLRIFDMMLGVGAAIALGALAFRCSGNWIAAGCAVALYLTVPESLKSHTLSYWAHQVYAPLFILQIYLFVFHRRSWLLPALAFSCGLLEWTAYLTNTAMAAMAFWDYRRSRSTTSRRTGIAIGLATLAAGIALICWYSSITSPLQYIAALRYRSTVRTATLTGFAMLAALYLVSFGPFIAPLMATWIARTRQLKETFVQGCWLAENAWRPVLLLCVAACAENLILTNHANQYSYDRLKGMQLAGLAMASVVAALPPNLAKRIFQMNLAAGLLSIAMFWWAYDYTQDFQTVDYAMHQSLGQVIRQTAAADVVAATNVTVRGHTLYYAGRNLLQGSSAPVVYQVSGSKVSVHQSGSSVTYDLGPAGPLRHARFELALLLCGRIDASTVRPKLARIRQTLTAVASP